MENIKVSIIVPVFNTEKYLDECVNSLINQTLKDIEIILVDDGSTDNSSAICDEFALKDNRIKVFHKENGGQSSARNLGVKKSNGEYILFVDSDDTILDVACEKMYYVAKELKADIVHGDTINQKEQIDNDGNVRYMPCENIVVDCYDYLRLALKYNCYDIVPWLNLIKKDYIIKNDLYFTEGRFYEDQEYALKLFTANNGEGKIVKIRFPFYFYRETPNSTTHCTTIKKVDDLFNILLAMNKYVSEYKTNNKKLISDMNSVLGISLYHLSSFFSKLKKEDRKEYIKTIKEKKVILKEISKKAKLGIRMTIQNKLFLIVPLVLANLLYKERIKK